MLYRSPQSERAFAYILNHEINLFWFLFFGVCESTLEKKTLFSIGANLNKCNQVGLATIQSHNVQHLLLETKPQTKSQYK